MKTVLVVTYIPERCIVEREPKFVTASHDLLVK